MRRRGAALQEEEAEEDEEGGGGRILEKNPGTLYIPFFSIRTLFDYIHNAQHTFTCVHLVGLNFLQAKLFDVLELRGVRVWE